MNALFQNQTNFNQPIGPWNTIPVTNMKSMFASGSAFNQPIGNWHISEPSDMMGMFQSTSTLKIAKMHMFVA